MRKSFLIGTTLELSLNSKLVNVRDVIVAWTLFSVTMTVLLVLEYQCEMKTQTQTLPSKVQMVFETGEARHKTHPKNQKSSGKLLWMPVVKVHSDSDRLSLYGSGKNNNGFIA